MLIWIVWNGAVFDIETIYVKLVWKRTDYLYEIYLAFNRVQRLTCHKNHSTNENQPKYHVNIAPMLTQKERNYIESMKNITEETLILMYIKNQGKKKSR